MKRLLLLVSVLSMLSGPVLAAEIVFPNGLTDQTFKIFVEEAGSLAAYRSLMPAEPGGLLGFDLGVSASAVEIDSLVWQQFFSDAANEDYLGVARIAARKGLPFNLDVGAFYAEVPDYDIQMYGAELQWALLEGGTASPAVALRGSYSRLDGITDFDLETWAADAVISKGFAFFTPYAGIGYVTYEGEYTGSNPLVLASLTETKQDFDQTRYFAGLQIALALLRVTAEYEYMEQPTYSAKVSLGW